MLILTRRIGEEIIIDDKIKTKILSIRGCQVKIGIEAPDDVVILRKEVLERILREKKEAADKKERE
jgi:carbon storage regulator